MHSTNRQIFETGTTQPRPARQSVTAGHITAVIDAGALRQISFGPVELVRQIDFPVRDENWATLQPDVTSETLEDTPGGFRFERHFEVADGALSCRVIFEAHEDGTVTATGEATARRSFITNRTGFTVLHPLSGVTANPVTVTTPAGEQQRRTMPDAISPGQPIFDIAGLGFDIHGVSLKIEFEDDVFEMEDQRNWSDASFKTYSRPLALPFPYEIEAGATVRQTIRLRISGDAAAAATDSGTPAIRLGPPMDEPVPELLLVAQADWLPSADETRLLAQGRFKSLVLRTGPETADADIAAAARALDATGGWLDLEIILDGDRPAGPQLDRVVSACLKAGIAPRHVTALPSAYLMSHQPTAPWPDGLTPSEACEAAQHAFPDARTGCGMLTNFTEFNRCPPDPGLAEFITHGNAATVHAADDWSVVQTLETLPDIFRSARAIGGEHGYRLGLTAIGMRSNPYGKAVSPNPEQLRLTMATWDPRARALFGAAWAVAALARTEGFEVGAMALAAPVGPFGVLSRAGPVARPWYDDHPQASVYPIFHALSFIAEGGLRYRVFGVPEGVHVIAFATRTATRLLIANPSDTPRQVRLAETGRGATLDAESFEAAACDPAWFDNSSAPLPSRSLILQPSAILFLETDAIETPAK
ncbi:hypothetical protein [Hoeflea ulvae]|uniref:Uncharacterized protein n=1 Tax=Hoeflea ulvae TaxID=2983764 RepID=A0ABT3YLY5_9HYPH|nr:hypothetical protein [Hoeflea ulvae]MCY0096735.1 hypothetical protein [Hoeflea ulvae]